MKLKIIGLPVNDQNKAIQFYTQVLGFTIKHDIPMGAHKWLTVVSAEHPQGVELLLEPLGFPPAADYQKALYEAGIPWGIFEVPDIESEYKRLQSLGVTFSKPPTKIGPVTMAILDDTCGNWIQIVQS